MKKVILAGVSGSAPASLCDAMRDRYCHSLVTAGIGTCDTGTDLCFAQMSEGMAVQTAFNYSESTITETSVRYDNLRSVIQGAVILMNDFVFDFVLISCFKYLQTTPVNYPRRFDQAGTLRKSSRVGGIFE